MQLHGAQTPLRTRPGSKQSLYKVLWVSDTAAEAPFLKIMAQDRGRWWKPFIFSPNKHYPPLDSENIKICFFSACKFGKFAKFAISTSHRFPRQSELWRREKLCTPDRLTEVFLSSVQEWLNGFGFQRSPLDIFQ